MRSMLSIRVTYLLIIPLIGVIYVLIKNGLGVKHKNSLPALIFYLANLHLATYMYMSMKSNSYKLDSVHMVDLLNLGSWEVYFGVDNISILFVLLTTFILPIALVANWQVIADIARVTSIDLYLVLVLLLETIILGVFLSLDIVFFYVFFESVLPIIFILISMYGPKTKKIRASYFLFVYTLFGSLFLLLSILTMLYLTGSSDLSVLYKSNFNYTVQIFLFYGLFLGFSVKTPVYGLSSWLLKAHVESTLGGSIVLAGLVLKLSLYGVLKFILPILPEVYLNLTYTVYIICVITVIYGSFSTLITTDLKELIAYSSISHASLYLMGAFSNSIQGIVGAILLGLAHGFVSSGLFICTGGCLYDRLGTRNISHYRGMAYPLPIFSIFFFILCLANCGTPLTFNFIGEFLSLYGIIERSPAIGFLAASSIVLSAGYSIYLYNRICLGGVINIPMEGFKELNSREFGLLLILVVLIVLLGIFPNFILEDINYSVSNLIYRNLEDVNSFVIQKI